MPECVVLLIDSNFILLTYDIILYFAYVAREGSPHCVNGDDDGIELLADRYNSIVTDYPNAALFLAGDFNARIKDFLDYIPSDDLEYVFGNDADYPAYEFNMSRKTKDNVYNNFGLSLIDLCCTFDVHALNGRMFDDLQGNFACTANNGTSKVDYMLASSSLFNIISNFGTGDIDFSVHFPLYYTITVTASNIGFDQSDDPLTPWIKYKWNSNFKDDYINNFKTHFRDFNRYSETSEHESVLSLLPNFISINIL